MVLRRLFVVRVAQVAAFCALSLARPTAGSAQASVSSLAASTSSPLDLNQADERALVELPGIGASRARAILAYRASRGGFRSVNELLRIRGIGRKLLAKLRTHVVVGSLASKEGAHPVR